MTSATNQPASQGRGGRYAEGHGYGLVLFASVLLTVTGFNLISGIAAVASSHVFTASAYRVSGSLTSWAWITLVIGWCPHA